MSDEVQKHIKKTLPSIHGGISMVPNTSLESMSEHELIRNSAPQYFSSDTIKVMENIRELEKKSLSISEKIHVKLNTLDERLFDARANVKILLSQVSMHFGVTLREKIFHQIDLLHDPDDWEVGDDPIQIKSFKSFLRWFYLNKPSQLPNFGLSNAGHFIATWLTNNNKDNLILEFLPNDGIKWFVTKYYDEEAEHTIGSTKLSRIQDHLAPYNTDDWFTKES